MSLAIFFQDFGLADRIASIATVMVAYTQFLTIVRAELPPTPKITFIELLVDTSIFINLLCLIESVSMRKSDEQKFEINAFLLFAIMFQFVYIFIIIGLIISYYAFWKPSYNVPVGVNWILKPF